MATLAPKRDTKTPGGLARRGSMIVPAEPPKEAEPEKVEPVAPEISDEELKRQQLEKLLAIEKEKLAKLSQEYSSAISKLPLPVDVIKRGLSNLGFCPQRLSFVYQKLSLPVICTDSDEWSY